MNAVDVVQALRANYFEPQGFGVRVDSDAAHFARILVRVQRAAKVSRVFGLRFVDYPHAPPTLRFWRSERWDVPDFVFDFTTVGDSGTGTTMHEGVPTMCIPYHAEYYRNGWHADCPWTTAQADAHVADLVSNILRRS